jgi:phospholipid transport system substrate-binding protein
MNKVSSIEHKGMILSFLYTIMLIMTISLIFPPGVRGEIPAQVVEKLHEELLEVMKDAEELGYTSRYEKLEKVIPAIYDFPFIARIVVGRYWNLFNEDEKKKFLDLFTRLGIATYADRFDGYSGESFKVVSMNDFRSGRIIVESVLVQASGDKIHLNYVLHEKDDMWKIIDVIIEGVSDLALKRADYTAFLRNNDTQALFDELSTRISKLSE